MNCSASALPLLGFPPPLWGRDREGGMQQTLAHVFTPHPNPPPQRGREQAAAWGGNVNNIGRNKRRR